MLTARIDIIITALFFTGLAQLAWFSVMLLRRNVPPAALSASLPPMISIWVLLWPLYEHPLWIWAGIILLALPLIPVFTAGTPFLQHLRIAWSGVFHEEEPPRMWPLLSLIAALAVAAGFFQRLPEFGLGIGLTICLAFPVADLLDRSGHVQLGFPQHPEQTLVGHIGLLISTTLLCGWSIHLYHGVEWQRLFIAMLLVGISASLSRAFLPTRIMPPLATLAMGVTLWLL
ncbi:MAG: hypothetical protein K9M17_06815 [Mariprofundaceae bacterium]|nr:hypothetical protein [Mariprofundaceae bacterium]